MDDLGEPEQGREGAVLIMLLVEHLLEVMGKRC